MMLWKPTKITFTRFSIIWMFEAAVAIASRFSNQSVIIAIWIRLAFARIFAAHVKMALRYWFCNNITSLLIWFKYKQQNDILRLLSIYEFRIALKYFCEQFITPLNTMIAKVVNLATSCTNSINVIISRAA